MSRWESLEWTGDPWKRRRALAQNCHHRIIETAVETAAKISWQILYSVRHTIIQSTVSEIMIIDDSNGKEKSIAMKVEQNIAKFEAKLKAKLNLASTRTTRWAAGTIGLFGVDLEPKNNSTKQTLLCDVVWRCVACRGYSCDWCLPLIFVCMSVCRCMLSVVRVHLVCIACVFDLVGAVIRDPW